MKKKNEFKTRIVGFDTGGLRVLIIHPVCAHPGCKGELGRVYPDGNIFRCAKCKKEMEIIVKAEGIQKK